MYTDLYGLNTIIFRYFNVFGERAPRKGQYAPVTGIFLRQKAAGEPLTIVGDGEQRRDYIYVKDVANANVMAAISNPDDCLLYTSPSPRDVSRSRMPSSA